MLQEAVPDNRLAEANSPPERLMTITISNLTVAQNAPAGTIVGMLTAGDAGSIIHAISSNKKSSGFFAIASNNIITAWSGSIAPCYYPCASPRCRNKQAA